MINPAHNIDDPIDKILEGIDELNAAINARIKSREFDTHHVHEISGLRDKMNNLQLSLIQIIK